MKTLEQRILKDGYVMNQDALKVDSFLNHQVDVHLIDRIGQAFRISRLDNVRILQHVQGNPPTEM